MLLGKRIFVGVVTDEILSLEDVNKLTGSIVFLVSRKEWLSEKIPSTFDPDLF